MKHPTTHGHRKLFLLQLLALLLLLTPAWAGDNEGVGTLPFSGDSDDDTGDGSNSSSTGLTAGLAMWAEQDPAPVEASTGTFDVDRDSSVATELETAESSTDATIAAVDLNEPVRLQDLDEGARLQGAVTVVASDDVQVVVRSPDERIATAAFLVLESGFDSLTQLLDDPTAGVLHDALPLGDVASLDLSKLKSLAELHADTLPGTHVTLLVATLDASGGFHVTAGRVSEVAGEPLELSAD